MRFQSSPNGHPSALQGYAGRLTECSVCHTTVPVTLNGGPHGMHTVGQAWVTAHHDNLSGGTSQCTYCHGADYRGTPLSALLTARSFNAGDYGTKSFHAGH
jgi:hypothetical protein